MAFNGRISKLHAWCNIIYNDNTLNTVPKDIWNYCKSQVIEFKQFYAFFDNNKYHIESLVFCTTTLHYILSCEMRLAMMQYLNTLRERQNGCHLPDDIFKCIIFDENVHISVKISSKFVPKGPINNIATLVQIMLWHHTQLTSNYLN